MFVLFTKINAQEKNLISRYRPGIMWFYTGIKPAIPEKVRKYDRLILDLTYNDWLGKNVKPFKNNWNSIGMNVALMFDIPLTKKNTVALGTGLSYGLFKINQNGIFVRNLDKKSTTLLEDAEKYGVENSVFKVNSISIPLELRFRGKNWKHVKLHLGGKFSYQFLPSTILSSSNNNIVSKQKTVNFYDFNQTNFSTHFRFGIRNWSIFAQYQFLPFFTAKESIKMNGFQFGLSLSLF